MNRLERFYKIHDLLKFARQTVPMKRFTEVLGVNRNTVTRDFEYLRNFFNAPIVYDRDHNGYLYDPKEPLFELPGLWLNATELHALLACEQWLGNVQPGLMGARLSPLRQRIRTLLKDAGQDAESMAERIRVQALHFRQVNDLVFMPTASATLSRKCLAFEYHSRGKDECSQRHVSPQQMIHYRNNWYLLAQCYEAGALRFFSLDRMSKVIVQEAMAENISSETLQQFMQKGFGIFSGSDLKIAQLRFSREAARWVAEENWHPEQEGEWQEGCYVLRVPYANATELIMDILRYGPEVEVLGPVQLREAVAEKIRRMHDIY